MPSYPVVEHKALHPVHKQRPWRRPRRSNDDLPLANAHEVLVFKSDGRYIVDQGRSFTDDDHVIRATGISVVDMRVDAPVTVRTEIPSAGAGEFTVQVTFLCTVKNPEEVVHSGLLDLTDPLLQYLVKHQPLFHLGEAAEFDAVSLVRRNVTAEIQAYASVRPPHFRGIDVKLGSVQVLTPDELREFENTRRAKRQEGILASEEQRLKHLLARDGQEQAQGLETMQHQHTRALEWESERHGRELAMLRQEMDEQRELQQRRHEQFVEEVRLGFAQSMERRHADHERTLNTERRDHAIGEANKLRQAIGAEIADLPKLLPHTAGEINMSETANLLEQDRQREREERAAELAWQREDNAQRHLWSRDDRRFELQVKLQALQTKMQTVRTGIDRGLADHRTIEHIEHIIDSVLEQVQSAPGGMIGAAAQDAEPREEEEGGRQSYEIKDSSGFSDAESDAVREEDLGS